MRREEYIERFREIYAGVGEKNEKKRDSLIELLADNLMQADECKEHIESDGCVTSMSQGKYAIDRVNPWSTAYDSKIKTIQSLIDKLDKMMPDGKTESITKAGESLARLVAKGKPLEVR